MIVDLSVPADSYLSIIFGTLSAAWSVFHSFDGSIKDRCKQSCIILLNWIEFKFQNSVAESWELRANIWHDWCIFRIDNASNDIIWWWCWMLMEQDSLAFWAPSARAWFLIFLLKRDDESCLNGIIMSGPGEFWLPYSVAETRRPCIYNCKVLFSTFLRQSNDVCTHPADPQSDGSWRHRPLHQRK